MRIDEKLIWQKLGVAGPIPSTWRRLLGEAERWFLDLGQPWSTSTWVAVETGGPASRVGLPNGQSLRSAVLARGFAALGVERALLVATTAGARVDAEIEQLFARNRPDAAFFLAAYAETVTETLRRRELAACAGHVLPHYAPGYAGWDIRDLAVLVPLLPAGCAPITFVTDSVLRPLRSTVVLAGQPAGGEAAAGGAHPHRYWNRFGGQTCTEVCPPCSCSML